MPIYFTGKGTKYINGVAHNSDDTWQNTGSAGGDGQTWWSYGTDNTTSYGRQRQTWFYNNSGGPIQVSIAMFKGEDNSIRITSSIANTPTRYTNAIFIGSDYSEAMNSFIVPQGHYYWAHTFRRWNELRKNFDDDN